MGREQVEDLSWYEAREVPDSNPAVERKWEKRDVLYV